MELVAFLYRDSNVDSESSVKIEWVFYRRNVTHG
jgi:hypothetical protein